MENPGRRGRALRTGITSGFTYLTVTSVREGLFIRQTGTQQTTQLKKQRVLSWNPANLTPKPCLSPVHLGQAGHCGRGGGGPGGVHLGV